MEAHQSTLTIGSFISVVFAIIQLVPSINENFGPKSAKINTSVIERISGQKEQIMVYAFNSGELPAIIKNYDSIKYLIKDLEILMNLELNKIDTTTILAGDYLHEIKPGETKILTFVLKPVDLDSSQTTRLKTLRNEYGCDALLLDQIELELAYFQTNQFEDYKGEPKRKRFDPPLDYLKGYASKYLDLNSQPCD